MAPVKPSPASVSAPTSNHNSATSSCSRFILPYEHQRKDINVPSSLSSTCARVMKETETSIEVSISSQTKEISFVVSGKSSNIKSAKRLLWSLLAQNVLIVEY